MQVPAQSIGTFLMAIFAHTHKHTNSIFTILYGNSHGMIDENLYHLSWSSAEIAMHGKLWQ